ncbi:MAG: DUF4290 domain-containing protein [Paludibacteraceae bacterium]|nr:DUF4290 domain-containing protein [Paludibacteraceae bacterium]
MTINTSPIIMPDYGRNVQNMIEHALTIEDAQQRQQCADTIIKTMTKLHPEFNNEEQKRIYYDHLALMSGFRLDIQYPYGTPQQDNVLLQPDKLPYNQGNIQYRYYGRVLMTMIVEATKETDPEKQKELSKRIAYRMRLSHHVWNKESVDEQQVKEDIVHISGGKLNCDFPEFHSVFSDPLPSASNKKKKKK